MASIELGLDTFGDVTVGGDGRPLPQAQVIRDVVEAATGPTGALAVGSPDTVAAKVVRAVSGLGAARYDMKYSAGTLPHELMMRSIELYGTEVAPPGA